MLYIELLELPELSGHFAIVLMGPSCRLAYRAFTRKVSIEELRDQLTKEFNAYVRDPQVYVRPVTYRPVRIYVGGEVKRPGYYTLTGVQSPFDEVNAKTSQFDSNIASPQTKLTQQSSIAGGTSKGTLFPTVFDAIRSAQGITPYSDLTKVEVTRKRAQGLGGGNIRTTLDFLSLITEGNESQNIRLFDSDVVIVKKSNIVMRDQLLQASQSNLSPLFVEVFVTGRVKNPGGIVVPQGSSVNQAIALAGGAKVLGGKIEFVRFTKEGEIEGKYS